MEQQHASTMDVAGVLSRHELVCTQPMRFWLGAHNSTALPYQLDQVCRQSVCVYVYICEGGGRGGGEGSWVGYDIKSARRGGVGLGYATQHSISSSSSSSSRRSRIGPWMFLVCLLAGYWLGAHNSRILPYQMDQVRTMTCSIFVFCVCVGGGGGGRCGKG